MAVEGHHGVSGVTDEHTLGAVMRRHLDRDQWRRLRGEEDVYEVLGADELERVHKVGAKEARELIGRLDRLEHVQRHEERARERAVLIGQRDEHEVAARPNVQVLGRQGERAARRGGYVQLDIVARYVGLREVHRFVLEQTGANGRVSAIAAEYEIRFDLHRLFTNLAFVRDSPPNNKINIS